MKKILIFLIMFILLICILTLKIFANTNDLGYACSIGSLAIETDHPIDIILITSNTSETYSRIGYNINSYLIDPKPLVIFSNALSSKVQFYLSHGNQTKIEFEEGGLGIGDNKYEEDGKSYYGIDMIDWTDKKLVTLAACQTAGNNYVNNDSIAGWIARKGAKMSVGWYTEIHVPNGVDWVKCYNDNLEEGKTVSQAIMSANSLTTAGDYKNVVLFNSGDISGITDANVMMKTNTEIINSKNILKDNIKEKVSIDKVNDIIKEYDSNIDFNDYQITSHEGFYTYNVKTNEKEKQASYIDYNLKIGDFITNSGYTVVLDKNEAITEINDNTIPVSKQTLLKLSKNKIQNLDKQYYINKAIKNITNSYEIIEEKIFFYYDLKEDKKYACVDIDVYSQKFGNETKTFYYEINN